MQSELHHPTYKFVSEQESDALAWVFIDKENMKKVPIKFPPLKPTEARAKVTYAGLCHTDCLVVRDEVGSVVHPICPGHEIVGIITQVGSEVKDLKVGDKAGFGAQRDCCDECEFCKEKDDHLCQGKLDQIGTYGDHYWGGYATHIQHPAKFFFKSFQKTFLKRKCLLFSVLVSQCMLPSPDMLNQDKKWLFLVLEDLDTLV